MKKGIKLTAIKFYENSFVKGRVQTTGYKYSNYGNTIAVLEFSFNYGLLVCF